MGMAAAWWHGAKTSDKALVRHQQEGTASNGQHEGKGLSRGKTQAPLRTPKGQRAGQEARAAARPPRCAESAASAPQGRKGLWQSHGYRGRTMFARWPPGSGIPVLVHMFQSRAQPAVLDC